MPNKPPCYPTEEFDLYPKTRITKICEDNFGSTKGQDGHKRLLDFNKNIPEKLKVNYLQITEIKIRDNTSSATTNTPNTFNTFWKGEERNDTFKIILMLSN